MSETVFKKSEIELSTPVQFLKGVGPARAKVFSEMGVEIAADLLEYFPRDWQFMQEPVKINTIKPEQEYTTIGLVESVDFQSYRRPQIFEAIIADETGICRVIWFNGAFLQKAAYGRQDAARFRQGQPI